MKNVHKLFLKHLKKKKRKKDSSYKKAAVTITVDIVGSHDQRFNS